MATMLDLETKPVTTVMGTEISGVDLTRPLPAAIVKQIRDILLDRCVIFFRDQDITTEQYWAFMENFGEVRSEEVPSTDVSTAENLPTADFARGRYSTAIWHADVTSLAEPTSLTSIRLLTIPPVGGDTCWSNMFAAYDALSEPMQAMLDGLTAIHSIQDSFDRTGAHGSSFEVRYSARHAAEQVHPVVIAHPETGRKALFVNQAFTTRILELTAPESAALLTMLFHHIQSPLLTLRWRWAPNDIAIWDNRSSQHFAVSDYTSGRMVQRVVLAGGPLRGPGKA